MSEDVHHWGELPPMDEVPEDFADMLIQNAVKPIAMKVHEPCDGEIQGLVELPPECSKMDDTILHTIKLLKYSKSMQCVIDKSQMKDKSSDSKDLVPPIFPEQDIKKTRHLVRNPFNYMEQVSTPFVEGNGISPHRLSERNARLILRKCVATIFAHIGFDDTTQVVLDIMTDICEEYYVKFTRLMRVVVDHESISGNAGFPDVMERVFHEMGVGSVLTLHNFYQEHVLMYHQRTLTQCRELAVQYSKVTTPVIKKEIVGSIVKCKIENEEIEEYGDVPELHFPALGDGCSAEELRPSLEPGFQMLHRIEQEEQLQNMIKEEQITVNDSPKQ